MSADDVLLAHLRTRRSSPFPLIADPGPSADELASMLAIAARVPDHGKLAPWRFIVIDRQAGAGLADFIEGCVRADDLTADADKIAKERGRFTRAPVCVAIVSRAAPHPKIPEWEQALSAGAVGLNLLHAVAAHGYGATWVTEWLAYDARVAERFGLSAPERFAGFVHIGTRLNKAEDRPRPNLSDLVTQFKG